MRPNEKRPRRVGVPDAAEYWNRHNSIRRATTFPDTLIDLWHDTADRFLCAVWWRLTDNVGLDDLERYRLGRDHFATDDQWSVAQALTAAWQFEVKPTIVAIHELATAAGCTYSACELQVIRYLESTALGVHNYAALLCDCVRRHTLLRQLETARLYTLNPTIPTDEVVSKLRTTITSNTEDLPEPPPIRLVPVAVQARRVG